MLVQQKNWATSGRHDHEHLAGIFSACGTGTEHLARGAKAVDLAARTVSHIRRLEEFYGVRLFQRTPRLRLTAAGEKLVRALNRIKLFENSLKAELAQDSGAGSGVVRFGLHPSRAFLLAPLVLPPYRKLYPGVRIDIENGTTRQFERRLLSGEIDCFIGVNPVNYSQFQILPLAEEQFYAVMSEDLFRASTGGAHSVCEFAEGLPLEQMALFPFIATSSYSSMGVYDAEWFSQVPRARIAASTSLISVIFDLIRADYAAGVLSTLHLYRFIHQCRKEKKRYHFFPIAPFTQKN
ncbi:MAG: LysR family transcriptional regulator, partial [Pyramidobacter sp.]|nr:LysR family transcriptional regulator [Pyramidobacter sp.]